MSDAAYTAVATVIAAFLGLIGVLARREAKAATAKAEQASDISFPLQALKETIGELRVEINRLQTIIEGLNRTIELDAEKYSKVVKERDELVKEKDRLENKVAKMELEVERLKKQAKARKARS